MKLEIALAIPAPIELKIETNTSAEQGLTASGHLHHDSVYIRNQDIFQSLAIKGVLHTWSYGFHIYKILK